MLRFASGVNVGAPQPRMTMQTNPLSPCAETLYPEAVSTLMVAPPDTVSGAALLASAISAWGSIMYSLSGGYLGLCARMPWAQKPAIRVRSSAASVLVPVFCRVIESLSTSAARITGMRRKYSLQPGEINLVRKELQPLR